MKKLFRVIVIVTLLFSIVSLFLEQAKDVGPGVRTAGNVIDYLIVSLVFLEAFVGVVTARYRFLYIKEHKFSLLFIAAFIVLFIIVKSNVFSQFTDTGGSISLLLILLRNAFLVMKIFGRFQKFSKFMENFTIHPAQSILLSFLFVILIGTLVLMMGFTTVDGKGLSFINGLFTSTSAVCVTGLIVVDTATQFTVWGQLVILILIQIGGLGIMILSFFAVFALRRTISLEDKLMLSYMLSEDDMSGLTKSLRNIILITFSIELAGAAVLFAGFLPKFGFSLHNAFLSVFHSVSAFCNAGFSLFSDSLESWRGDPVIIVTVAVLIILGGLSFAVITNVSAALVRRIRRRMTGSSPPKIGLTLNTKIILKYTLLLIVSGMVVFYFLEHANVMKKHDLGDQYLSAFFQSVTLRTAGFNSVPFGAFLPGTYLFMIVFMFIGAASGGTAGGIKINAVVVIGSYLRSFIKGEKQARLGNYSVSPDRVGRSFIILLFGLFSVIIGTFLLSLTERASFLSLFFEATSAFGTVGLSAGVTATLSVFGKMVIIGLMYLGRLGPLTILSAASRKKPKVNIEYPMGDVSIG
ncbi:MAG: TrkH family potassium uptake protein [Spirochaetales bacterium]|nr:TrkH family potassium uptake protein [Spirochaetales bacterium]